MLTDEPWWVLALAVAVAVVSAARLTRLLVFDDYPPVVWVRRGWDRLTNDGPWSQLVHCGFCAAPWILAAVAAWGWLSHLHWTWWVLNAWLAASYVASIIVAYDQPEG